MNTDTAAQPGLSPNKVTPNMQLVGFLFLIVGTVLAVFYFVVFDNSVPVTTGGGRVHNVGLMQQQSQGTLLAFALIAIGMVMVIAAKHNSRGTPVVSAPVVSGQIAKAKTEAVAKEPTMGLFATPLRGIVAIIFIAAGVLCVAAMGRQIYGYQNESAERTAEYERAIEKIRNQ